MRGRKSLTSVTAAIERRRSRNGTMPKRPTHRGPSGTDKRALLDRDCASASRARPPARSSASVPSAHGSRWRYRPPAGPPFDDEPIQTTPISRRHHDPDHLVRGRTVAARPFRSAVGVVAPVTPPAGEGERAGKEQRAYRATDALPKSRPCSKCHALASTPASSAAGSSRAPPKRTGPAPASGAACRCTPTQDRARQAGAASAGASRARRAPRGADPDHTNAGDASTTRRGLGRLRRGATPGTRRNPDGVGQYRRAAIR